MSLIDKIFGKQQTPSELMREYKRKIDRSIREIERERMRMQQQEKKIIADMKRLAKQNQIEPVKIMAKDLVRTRRSVTKFYKMKAQLQAVSLRLQTLKSTAEMTKAMKGVTRAMMAMNKQMDMPTMSKVMQEFSKQNEMMDMKDEMMNDMLDDAFEEEEDEEEEGSLVNQVLDEIGLDLKGQIDTPANALNVKQTQEVAEDDDLQARLENLKKN